MYSSLIEYYDMAGERITSEQYNELFRKKQTEGYGHVAYNELSNGIEVMTDWVGYSSDFDNPRGVFETLVQHPGGGEEKYSTSSEEDARKLHDLLCVALAKQAGNEH